MKYHGQVFGDDVELSIETEGLSLGSRFLDFADIASLRPINHRVFIDTLNNENIEISMLGFSYDGFWEDLINRFGCRSMEALHAEEQPIMRCGDGEYHIPNGRQGRGVIYLLPDAICILPPDINAVRIPLCFTRELILEGYLLKIIMRSGEQYTVGRMGYDTIPFAERAQEASEFVKKQRDKLLSKYETVSPYTYKGLFRTETTDQYWLAAFGKGCCAVELYTGDNSATYLYRFSEPKERFLQNLEEAMEAVGIYREIIYCSDKQLNEKPLYRMAVNRSEAIRYLRSKTCGRLIHNASHSKQLEEFLD